jgi:hypothetical protein
MAREDSRIASNTGTLYTTSSRWRAGATITERPARAALIA